MKASQKCMRNIPLILMTFRFFLGPLVIFISLNYTSPALLFVLVVLGILSDIFDGIIARRMGVATKTLRRLDSQIDLIFWLCIIFASYIAQPAVIHSIKNELLILILLELICYLISFLKFGRETCTHAISAKFYGIFLCISMISILSFGSAGFPFKLAFIAGLIANFDVILIILFLPYWTHDIPSAYHAYLIRQNISFRKYQIFNS